MIANWIQCVSVWLCLMAGANPVGPAVRIWEEGFEIGAFTTLSWSVDHQNPWTIVHTKAHQGKFSARSGEIDFGQESELSLEFTAPTWGEFSFWMTCKGESPQDTFTFFIDGKEQGLWNSPVAWTQSTSNLTAGFHRLTWVFSQDSVDSESVKAVWIDEVKFEWLPETEMDWLSPAAGAFFLHESTNAPWTHSR